MPVRDKLLYGPEDGNLLKVEIKKNIAFNETIIIFNTVKMIKIVVRLNSKLALYTHSEK